ncbi:Hypothetical protein NTJ_00399 [Nesidiocoris tenuis]|uniref:Uncharacterized protein n=1 Tax=Nesidiocoris tenuis TaxID=355587 RepID=A0ABN7A621_9HEMI|nr:Hypothetical protein NTJ_00399 [Nesidiocoris tenuis]
MRKACETFVERRSETECDESRSRAILNEAPLPGLGGRAVPSPLAPAPGRSTPTRAPVLSSERFSFRRGTDQEDPAAAGSEQ